MKNLIALVLGIIVAVTVLPYIVFGQSAATWIPSNGYLKVFNSTYGIQVQSLLNCDTIDTDGTGKFLCGTDGGGGGGGGAGTVGTSTIPVVGEVAFWTGTSTLSSVATGTLSCTGPLSCTARSVIGGDTAISLSTAGDWTGTFDGQEGSYYLANSFSTTSANTWLASDQFFGIGTSSPDTKVFIEDEDPADGYTVLAVRNATSTGRAELALSAGADQPYYSGFITMSGADVTNQPNTMEIGCGFTGCGINFWNDGALQSRMDANGFFSIGTTTLFQQQLTVDGNASVLGDGYFGDSVGDTLIQLRSGSTRNANIRQEGSTAASPLVFDTNGALSFRTDSLERIFVSDVGTVSIPALTNCSMLDTDGSGVIRCRSAISTSTIPVAGQVAFWTSPTALSSVATGTVSGTNGITVTAARAALGGALAIDCTAASGSATGCLTSGNFTIFNEKVSSTSIDTSSELDGLITDQTGSGALVFGTSPTFTSPTLTSYYSAACASGEAVQDISDTGTFTCIAVGGGGGGGALSTTTDLVGVGPTSTVSYVTGDVMFGGSSSTTAEFQLDDDGAQFIISSSSANATSTFANTNSAQAIQFGTASVTNPSIVAGFDIDFKTAGQAIMRALGTVTDFVFNLPVRFASTVKDGSNSAGSNGNVLTSTGTGVAWVATSSLGISGGGGSSFTVGPTSTPIWRSTLQGWTFPDGANVNTDIAANRFHTIKPIWYEVDAAGGDIGTLDQRTVAGYGAFGYNASNTELIKQYSTEQFVTVSGNHPEIHTLTGSSTLVTTEIAELIAFATSTGFTGIELDWEGFADWTAQNTTDYINFVTQLSNEAHKYGLKTMIYLPPIWNSAANSESGSGDEWDSANSDGYYELEYEDFENVPVDYIVIAVYDYQFDYGAGRPNAPLKWQDEIISYAKRKISDHDRLIIGIPAAGYGGATGGFSFTAYTYASSTVLAGFSGATRDTESGELTWTNGGNSYFVCDDTCINTKRERVEREGINRVSLWHIGNNKYGSGKAEPTIQEPPATTQTDSKFFGELSGFIARFFSSAGSLVMSITDSVVTVFGNMSVTGNLTVATTTYHGATTTDAIIADGRVNTGEYIFEQCVYPTAETTQVAADVLRGCIRFSYLEDAAGVLDFVPGTTALTPYFRLRPGTAGTSAALGDGMGIGFASGFDFGDFQKFAPVMEWTMRTGAVQNSSSTIIFAGFTDTLGINSNYAAEPGQGFYVAATSTNNWIFACNPSSGATTNIDTGIATTTVTTGDSTSFQHFRIDISGTVNTAVTATLRVRTSTTNLTQVASCTINLSASTAAVGPNMGIGKTVAGTAPELHVQWIKLWTKMPLN